MVELKAERETGERERLQLATEKTMARDERGVSFLLCDLQEKPWRETREKIAERQRREEHCFLIVKRWAYGSK